MNQVENDFLGMFEGKAKRRKAEKIKALAGGDIDFNAIAAAAKSVVESNNPKSNTTTYVIVGVLALVVISVVFFYLKKR